MAIDPWSYAEKSGTEHAHQTALFMWANMACRFGLEAANDRHSYLVRGHVQNYQRLDVMASRFDDAKGHSVPVPQYVGVLQLKWLHAIHNQGHGDAIRGGKAKAEGVKAGVSDLFLPVSRGATFEEAHSGPSFGGIVCGLYLELKVGKNTPSEIQLEFMADMRAAGYAADWAIGWLEAREKILAYLQITA